MSTVKFAGRATRVTDREKHHCSREKLKLQNWGNFFFPQILPTFSSRFVKLKSYAFFIKWKIYPYVLAQAFYSFSKEWKIKEDKEKVTLLDTFKLYLNEFL